MKSAQMFLLIVIKLFSNFGTDMYFRNNAIIYPIISTIIKDMNWLVFSNNKMNS